MLKTIKKIQVLNNAPSRLWILVCNLFVFGLLFSPHSLWAQDKQDHMHGINTIVIDPGHGGKDPGASSKYAKEKNVVLQIGLKLRKYIQDSLPDVKVIMTRDKDFFVELERRAQIANNAKADLFISIHANSNPKSTPCGTETYAMGLHKSKQNLAVAQKENSVILQEVNYQKRYNGFNPNSPEAYIIFTMFQNVYLDRSLKLANLVEKNFASIAHRSDRGVKQAGFWVLWRTAMPSILIETGFVSNPAEGKYLASEKGQDQLAYAIFKAFQSYKDDFESQLPQDTEKETPSAVNKDLVYKVQIASSKQKINLRKNTEFKNLSDVDFFESNGWYKYTTGRFYQFDEANTAFQEIKKQYKDAFLVAFYKGKKISVKKAHKLEKKLREKN